MTRILEYTMAVLTFEPNCLDSLFHSPTLPNFDLPSDLPAFETAAQRLTDLHKQAGL